MALFRHLESGEQVEAPVDHPEGARLALDPAWEELDGVAGDPNPDPAGGDSPRRRRKGGEDTGAST